MAYGDPDKYECPAHPHKGTTLTRHQKAVTALDTRAHEAFVRLESQAKYGLDPKRTRVTKLEFDTELDAVVEEVQGLRYLVTHLVMVLKRNGIDPFRHRKGVKR